MDAPCDAYIDLLRDCGVNRGGSTVRSSREWVYMTLARRSGLPIML